ncbi:hypothetical protein ACF0H5_005662 [Mactra antiquata]
MSFLSNKFSGRILRGFVWLFIIWLIIAMFLSFQDLMFQHRLPTRSLLYNQIESLLREHQIGTDTFDKHTEQFSVIVPPVMKIGFLKVHKAASTTTQAIFLRYGWRRNLTFVLPKEYNKIGFPNVISTSESLTDSNILPPPSGRHYSVLCHHVIFGEKEWDHFLPPGSVYIGTVREPFRAFTSTLNYFNPLPLLSAKKQDQSDPVTTFLENHERFERKNIRISFTNNRQSFEFGVDPSIIRDKNVYAFNKFIENVLEERFALVIVAERYDESLVLLKRKLNWELSDILYVVKNVKNKNKPNRYNMKEHHKELYQDFAMFDYLLYDYFSKRLKKQIENEADFDDEVKCFRKINKFVDKFCNSVPNVIESTKIPKTKWNDDFYITRDDCEIMHTGEIAFTQMIRVRQYGSATWTGRKSKPPNNNGSLDI